MKAKVLISQVCVGLFLVAAASMAQEPVRAPEAAGSEPAVQAPLPAPPEAPALPATGTPEPKNLSYPPPGYVIFYDDIQQPNCVWTCENGAVGGKQVTTEIKCRQACKAACGPESFCFVL